MNNITFDSGAINAGDCFGNSWTQVMAKFGLYLGMALITLLLVGCIPIISIFLVGPVMGGFYFVALKDMRGEQVDFGMLFRGFDKFVPLMVIGIIQSIPGIIFQILRFVGDFAQIMGSGMGNRRGDFFQSSNVPDFGIGDGISLIVGVIALAVGLFSIVWSLVFKFAIPLAMENDIGVVDALKISASAAFSNVGGLILMLILSILAGIAGVLALCFGIFVAIPVIWVAEAFAYRQVFPLIERQMNFSPPPPTAYGNFNSGLQG